MVLSQQPPCARSHMWRGRWPLMSEFIVMLCFNWYGVQADLFPSPLPHNALPYQCAGLYFVLACHSLYRQLFSRVVGVYHKPLTQGIQGWTLRSDGNTQSEYGINPQPPRMMGKQPAVFWARNSVSLSFSPDFSSKRLLQPPANKCSNNTPLISWTSTESVYCTHR